MFLSTNPFLDMMAGDQTGYFTGLKLSSVWSGYVPTAKILREKFIEVRAGFMIILVIHLLV